MADSDDDWRVTLSVSQPQAGQEQPTSLRQAEEDIRRQVGRGIGVGAGEGQIFLYAGTEAAAAEAERIARDVLAQAGLAAGSAVHRWHPVEERWETPDVPMPRTAAEREAEHQRLMDDETAESLASVQDGSQVRHDGLADVAVDGDFGQSRRAQPSCASPLAAMEQNSWNASSLSKISS